MTKLEKPAILVVDMLNDFVTGALTCERARAIVPAAAELLDAARAADVPVIFCNDAHLKGIDRELKIWGDHAIAGTKGAEVIPELKLSEKDYVVPKRRYSGFFQTDLDILLTELGVKTVVMTGLHAHMCVRHTSADAFCLGYVLEGLSGMARILIKETTSMERIEIVKDALDGEYDDFYDDYVSGKKELAELNREFSEKHAGSVH